MKAVETTYAGTLFRSRLEARWGAFFDALVWPWTYEPPLGRGYLPDFSIGGAAPLLVEVKPAVAEQDYLDALGKVAVGLDHRWQHDALVVGLSPVAASLDGCCRLHPAAGMLGRGRSFGRLLVSLPGLYRHRGRLPWSPLHRHPMRPQRRRHGGRRAAAAAVLALWAQATNRVRWTPTR